MAVPTSPFCVSADVAPYLAVRLKGAGDFVDGVTAPSKANVDIFIANIATQILARFRLAGYVIPITASGTWPSEQTDFLKVLNVMGACALMTSPFIENPGRRSGDGNSFEIIYQSGLSDIYDKENKIAGPFFGCSFRSATAANKAVVDPALPTTSHLLEMYDPARHAGFQYWTDKSREMQDYMEDTLKIKHNFDYDLNDLNKGPNV